MLEADLKALEAMHAMAQERLKLSESLAPKTHERLTMKVNVALGSIVSDAFESAVSEYGKAFDESGALTRQGYDHLESAFECGKRGMWAIKTILETYSPVEFVTTRRTGLPPEILALHESYGGMYADVAVHLTHENVGKWVWHPDGYAGRILGTGIGPGNMNMILVGWTSDPASPDEMALQWELPEHFWATFDVKPSAE